MWSEVEDIIEIVASVLVVVAALWALTAKFWRTTQVVNRIVDSNLLERLEGLLAREESRLNDRVEPLNNKRAS